MPPNWNLLGHTWAVELLKGHLQRGAPRHAYLFTGPQGVGRRTLALRFAQALNAENSAQPGDIDPEHIRSQQIERMQHPDLFVVERQEGDRDIKVDAVRALQHSLALAPYEAPYRVALLRDFEHASNSAQNAMLKTLEEPPGRVVLLVTAESAEALLPTITSRCEVLRLRPLALDIVSQGLQEQWGLPVEQAELLAHISGGRPGYALHLHNNPEILEARSTWLDEQQGLLAAPRRTRFDYAEGLAKDKDSLQAVLLVWLSFWRDVLLRTAQAAAPLANPDRAAEIDQLSQHLDLNRAKAVVAAIERTLGLLKSNANARLATEVLLLDLPSP
ncbi:MAG: DNA polymerase III subunit delta' [Chloroflexi bacterium]|nr:MAG: DNA polymerase III subunit delta' [Chloroflexota bacterium]MBL1193241.1 DNA polymerase III subunit delta' [Chloroflexota bacterium]NOH10536.1 DNA polymerase III subunit delta' [Chloroflexota bacterium]